MNCTPRKTSASLHDCASNIWCLRSATQREGKENPEILTLRAWSMVKLLKSAACYGHSETCRTIGKAPISAQSLVKSKRATSKSLSAELFSVGENLIVCSSGVKTKRGIRKLWPPKPIYSQMLLWLQKVELECDPTLTTMEYAANMMAMITRNPVMSLQARCSVAVKMFILGFNLSRRQSFRVDSSTRKAIRYWSVESATALS